ncbi:MAG: VanW family protein [Candidatus Uhrbacteria bacterium]|nr:VanW family protein [Candidatus Uhrbacteria bacterium]
MNFLSHRSTKPIGIIVILICATATIGVLLITREETRPIKILSNISALGIPLDHLNREQALRVLKTAIDDSLKNGWYVNIDGHSVEIEPVDRLIHYDTETVVDQALLIGRSDRPWKNSAVRGRLFFRPIALTTAITLDQAAIQEQLNAYLEKQGMLRAPQDAELHVTFDQKKQTFEAVIKPERPGLTVDFSTAFAAWQKQASQLTFSPLTIQTITIEPLRRAQDLNALLPDIPTWLDRAPFILTAEDQKWKVTTSTLAGWLDGVTNEKSVILGLNEKRMEQTLRTWLQNILRDSRNGKLVLEENLVKEFVAPEEGLALAVSSTAKNIEDGWTNGSSSMAIVLRRAIPTIEGEDAKRLGIKEMIGMGRSNFAGSPVNRRKNIAMGAAKVNGALIPPGEEFSLVKTLGSIDGENGWVKELVIKGNKTVPEYGGGLCQIGTTTFRAALGSGMPITARTNHAYRVPYYEPAGTDATIYEPAPDFRFKNDMEHWVMITTHIQGNDLAFRFWGTKDGRVATQSAPKMFNFVPPPEKKIIETLDLKPGETKCTEKAHTGADARFDYTVNYSNGERKNKTFYSHYKPWGAVCLLGVSKLSTSSTTTGVDETGINNPN